MNDLFQDLKFGIRMLAKTPVVSGVAALSLALGIAAATAMFALASAFWLEPLPFGDQEGLILIRELRHGESIDMAAAASVPNRPIGRITYAPRDTRSMIPLPTRERRALAADVGEPS